MTYTTHTARRAAALAAYRHNRQVQQSKPKTSLALPQHECPRCGALREILPGEYCRPCRRDLDSEATASFLAAWTEAIILADEHDDLRRSSY